MASITPRRADETLANQGTEKLPAKKTAKREVPSEETINHVATSSVRKAPPTGNVARMRQALFERDEFITKEEIATMLKSSQTSDLQKKYLNVVSTKIKNLGTRKESLTPASLALVPAVQITTVKKNLESISSIEKIIEKTQQSLDQLQITKKRLVDSLGEFSATSITSENEERNIQSLLENRKAKISNCEKQIAKLEETVKSEKIKLNQFLR